MKILVIGAGLFGTSVAYMLADKNNDVDIVEKESDILQMASQVNHNRIHLGYHYLRSIQTAEQSIEGLLSFLFHFGNAVRYQFPNYYAIAKENSRTNAEGFIDFCNKVGIGYEEEYPEKSLLDPGTVESSFMVPEPVWDYRLLYNTIKKHIAKPNINIKLRTVCNGLRQFEDGTFEATLNNYTVRYDVVVNCTYSDINSINTYLGLNKKILMFEDVLIPEFRFNSPAFGITIMDGPFCSVMPKGISENSFLLYHVKKSVLEQRISTDKPIFGESVFSDLQLSLPGGIYHESSFFMPFLLSVEPQGYKRITRAVYENSDDARLTQLMTFEGIKNYFTILSGKVSTCMQVAIEIKHILMGKPNPKKFRI